MSKAPTIKIPVEWESKNQVAFATFEKGCNAVFITKELNNAPVDLENERTRHFAKAGRSESNPASKAYHDTKIVLKIPSKSVDADYVISNSIWRVANPSFEATKEYPVVLEFLTELKTDSKEKQLM